MFPDGVWEFSTDSVDDLVQMAREIVSIETQLLNNYAYVTTWTPTIIAASGTVGGYTRQSGRLQKIGRMVSFSGEVELSSVGTLTGNVSIGGLPYSALTTSASDVGDCSILYFSGLTANAAITCTGLVESGANTVVLYSTAAPVATVTRLQASILTNSTRLVFSGNYLLPT